MGILQMNTTESYIQVEIWKIALKTSLFFMHTVKSVISNLQTILLNTLQPYSQLLTW